MKYQMFMKIKVLKKKENDFVLAHPRGYILLISVKMPTILTFMSMINWMLTSVEHEKSFITLNGIF